MKRGEMTIGVIVGLAIALIVLVLILAILIPRFTTFGKSTSNQNTDSRICYKIGHCETSSCASGTAQPAPQAGWIDCTGTCCVP
jgi:hypothetical protein